MGGAVRTHHDIRHEGNLGDDARVKMTFDEDSIAHLMAILTDLYSDPELAVIREYSTNALDAHRAAGNPAPIEVTLPSSLSETFVVRDQGVGMSVDDITHHFSKYGWSSKRDTDDEVGMLGLGCKSGLAYTSQFTLVSVKDGVKATVLVTRDSDGAGAVQVIDTCGTDEPNGTEVQVPVKDVVAFRFRAQQFLRFWEPGAVLVDGEPPGRVEGLWLDDDVLITAQTDFDYLVMGNVPYPVDFEHRLTKALNASSIHAVVWVPIGSVNFTPSRESLQMTKRTMEVLAEAEAYIARTAARKAQEAVDAAASHWEAAQIASTWRQAYGCGDTLRYRGEDVPLSYCPKGPALRWDSNYRVSSAARRIRSMPKLVDLLSQNTAFVVGHHARSLHRNDKQRLRKAVEKAGLLVNGRAPVVYASPEPIGGEWLAGIPRLDWEQVKRIELPKPAPAVRAKGGPTDGAVKVLSRDGKLTYAEKLEGPALYIDSSRRLYNRSKLVRFVKRVDPTAEVIPVAPRSTASFRQRHPEAVDAVEWVRAVADLFAAGINAVTLLSVRRDRTIEHSGIASLFGRASVILDPELRAMVLEFDMEDESLWWGWLAEGCDAVLVPPPALPESAAVKPRFEQLQRRYPLLSMLQGCDFSTSDALVQYVNAVFLMARQPPSTDDSPTIQKASVTA